jgi:hypothetical protein
VQEVFKAMMAIQNFRIQSGIFFGTVNVGALGVALSTQKAGLFFFAAVLMWAFMWIDIRGRSALAGFYYRGIQLLQQFAPEDNDSFLNIILVGIMDSPIRKIAKLPEREKRLRALRMLPLKSPVVSGFWLPLIASLVEIAAALIAWLVLHWTLF